MRLTTKIGIGLAAILAVQISSGGFLHQAGTKSAERIGHLTQVLVVALASITEVSLHFEGLRNSLALACAEEDEDAIANASELSIEIDQILRGLTDLTQDDTVDALRTRILTFAGEGTTLCTSLVEGEDLENFGDRFRQFAAESKAISEGVEEYRREKSKSINSAAAESLSALELNQRVLSLSLVLSIFIVLGVGLYLKRVLRHHLVERIARIASAIARGDLTHIPVTDRRDEAGEIAFALSKMVDSLAHMIGEVQQASDVVNLRIVVLTPAAHEIKETALRLGNDAQKLQVATEESAGAITTVASAVEEISTIISGVASAANETSSTMTRTETDIESLVEAILTARAASDEMSKNLRGMSDSSSRSREVAAQATERATDASQLVRELGDIADEIAAMVDVVEEISERTNLLALNATIEAASAGDAGRGFGVVASEVKELALETKQATKNIFELVGSVSERSSRAAEAMQGVTDIMGTVVVAANEIAGVVTREQEIAARIAAATDTATSTAGDVREVVADTSQKMQGLACSAKELASAINEISKTSSSTMSSTRSLEGLVTTLEKAAIIGRARADLTLDNVSAVALEVERIGNALSKFRISEQPALGGDDTRSGLTAGGD